MIYFKQCTARLHFVSSRWCGIRRLPTTLMSHIQLDSTSLHLADATFVASNKKRICCSESKLSLQHILFLFLCDSLLTHKEKYHPRQFNVRNGTRKCASRGSNPAHPESPRAFYISLLCIILCYKNARNPFVYRTLRAI